MPKRPAKKKSRKKDSLKFLILLAVAGFFLLVNLVVWIIQKSNSSKELLAQTVMQLNSNNEPYGPFKAWDILATSDNHIVVSDQTQNRILVLDSQGKLLQEIGKKEIGDPPLKEISCLTSDDSGDLYIIDPWVGTIRGFDPKGGLMLNMSLDGKGFYGPRGVAWDKGHFYVADTGSHRLVKLSPAGSVEASWGKPGSGSDNFNNPSQVVTDHQGHFYVADQQNNRIQVLDGDGHFLKQVNLGSQPSAIAVDPKQDRLYVSSTEGRFVRVYTLNGKLTANLVEGDKKEPLQNVSSLSVLSDGDLLAGRIDQLTVYHLVEPPAGQP